MTNPEGSPGALSPAGTGALDGPETAVVPPLPDPGTAARASAEETRLPSVVDALNRCASSMPLSELEMRLFDPDRVVDSLSNDDVGSKTMAEVYRSLHEGIFTGACGDTAELLRNFTFSDPTPSPQKGKSLNDFIAELTADGDANLTFSCKSHAFFVEKRGDSCQILQSYIGRATLIDSLQKPPIPTEELAGKMLGIRRDRLKEVRSNPSARTFQVALPDEKDLFFGVLLSPEDVSSRTIEFERSSNIDSSAIQDQKIKSHLDQFSSKWDAVKISGDSLREFTNKQKAVAPKHLGLVPNMAHGSGVKRILANDPPGAPDAKRSRPAHPVPSPPGTPPRMG